jgi:hypothetical protein
VEVCLVSAFLVFALLVYHAPLLYEAMLNDQMRRWSKGRTQHYSSNVACIFLFYAHFFVSWKIMCLTVVRRKKSAQPAPNRSQPITSHVTLSLSFAPIPVTSMNAF